MFSVRCAQVEIERSSLYACRVDPREGFEQGDIGAMNISVEDLGDPAEAFERPPAEWIAECILLRYVLVSHFGVEGMKEIEEHLPGLVKVIRESGLSKPRWWEFWK